MGCDAMMLQARPRGSYLDRGGAFAGKSGPKRGLESIEPDDLLTGETFILALRMGDGRAPPTGGRCSRVTTGRVAYDRQTYLLLRTACRGRRSGLANARGVPTARKLFLPQTGTASESSLAPNFCGIAPDLSIAPQPHRWK